jgi:hypothetical protein
MSRNKEQGASQRHMGPQIVVRSPQEGARITAPFELDIQFMSAKGAAIDLDSLRVHFRKVWNIDITDYVRPYVSPEGIRMTNATLPRGRHTVTLAIADNQGRTSSRTMTMEIV